MIIHTNTASALATVRHAIRNAVDADRVTQYVCFGKFRPCGSRTHRSAVDPEPL